MNQDEHFERFIKKWKKRRQYGWGIVKMALSIGVVVGLFYLSMWVTSQQEGLMPGGTIPGEAKSEIVKGVEKPEESILQKIRGGG